MPYVILSLHARPLSTVKIKLTISDCWQIKDNWYNIMDKFVEISNKNVKKIKHLKSLGLKSK